MSPKGYGTKRQGLPRDWEEPNVLAVIGGIKNKYFRNKDETKIFVPTKEYAEFGVHQRQAVFCVPC